MQYAHVDMPIVIHLHTFMDLHCINTCMKLADSTTSAEEFTHTKFNHSRTLVLITFPRDCMHQNKAKKWKTCMQTEYKYKSP